MNKSTPKYSIVIPARNGLKYLSSCLESIVGYGRSDYEVIVSDNYSSDGTKDFLSALRCRELRVVTPPTELSMASHFEWAVGNARGTWIIFLGADDGLMPYFFSICDRLTEIASRMKIRAIGSNRAYYFWPGCEETYGDLVYQYNASPTWTVVNSRLKTLRVLFGLETYFELPEMYSNSIFHRDLIVEVLDLQGQLLTSITPDANLAAIAVSLERRYLRSSTPLGWVGTSPSSNGYAATNSKSRSGSDSNFETYLRANAVSGLRYHPWAGDIRIMSSSLLFWEALLQTELLRSSFINTVIKSRWFRFVLFVLDYSRVVRGSTATIRGYYASLFALHGFSLPVATLLAKSVSAVRSSKRFAQRVGKDLFYDLKRVVRKLTGIDLNVRTKSISLTGRGKTRSMKDVNDLVQIEGASLLSAPIRRS